MLKIIRNKYNFYTNFYSNASMYKNLEQMLIAMCVKVLHVRRCFGYWLGVTFYK